MKWKKRSFILVMFAFLCVMESVFAEDPEVQAVFKESSPRIGEVVSLFLKFTLPSGYNLPDNLEIKGIDQFDILKKKIIKGGIEVDLLVDRPDEINVPALEIYCYTKEGEKKVLKSGPARLKVVSTINKKSSPDLLRPVKGIISTKLDLLDYAFVFSGIIFLSGLIFFAYRIYKRMKMKKAFKADPVIPPHIKAMHDLENLLSGGTPDNSQIKRFYFRLSEILREYIGKIRAFNPLELTVDEISGFVKKKEDFMALDLLKQIDLVKFADFEMSSPKIKEHLALSREYINTTKPVNDIGEGREKSLSV